MKLTFLKKMDSYTVYIYTRFWSQFFFTFIFTVNLLYHVKVVGLDPLQLVLVGTVLEAVVFLFEIPTGFVADLKSRRLSVIIGYFLIGAGFLIEGSFPYFAAVLVSQVLWGIGYTFTSGAHQAWIADEIGEDRASVAFVNGAKAGTLGEVIAIPLSMLIGYFFMINLPIIIGGLSMLGLAVILLLFMKEENFKPVQHENTSTWKTLKNNINEMVHYTKASYIMRILFLISLFFGLYSEGFDRLWISHFLEETHLAYMTEGNLVILIGSINFVVMLLSFIGLHFISRSSLHHQLNTIYASLLIGCVLIITSLTGFALSTGIIGLLCFYLIIQGTRSVMAPLEDTWLNKIIPDSSTRATFFSVKGQVDAIGQIGGGPAIGFIAANFSIKIAMIVSAILLTPVIYLYQLAIKKSRE
ncbi:MFS transporter [Mesobacillus subterraneus]|uniref:MFS transporter n=1 Tax=Mesobacillus subterraneus TaxID=285983 RepID=UPI00273FFAC1|nr:MFS transporter [Mesobacillus subterraneus]WLR54663.1 MFS transporter [Mesobacillus subterraneus]